MMDSITNGTVIEINETGTTLRFKPGVLIGGKLKHNCGTSRSIGYFLEALVMLAPFAKKPMRASLEGITNGHTDMTIDAMRAAVLPLLKRFGLDEGLVLKVKTRGAPPAGGGVVEFTCPHVRELRPLHLKDEGLIKRIRGIAYTAKVSPQHANRMVDAARGVLNSFLPDVYIFTDHNTGKDSGASPGFGMTLYGETTTGCVIAAECMAEGATLPEDLGKKAAHRLCAEIGKGGCVDSIVQSIALTLMVFTPEDVSRLRVGSLTPYTIDQLRLLRTFFGVVFKIKPEPETKTVLMSCVGMGLKNLAKKVT
jgi:RNA 3'-terminal phosphate cyclase-like protein